MFDLLRSIVDVITTLITFLWNTITSLLALITNIPTYVGLLISSINIMPAFLIPFMLAFVSLVVVQYLVNRRV